MRIYSLKLLLPNKEIVVETIEREEGVTTELFDALCAAIAKKFDARVLDVQQLPV